MPFFTMAGAALFGAGTFLAGATAFALQMAAGVGLSLIAKAIAGKPEQEAVGIQGSLAQGGDVPRALILGRYNTAGSLVYHGTYGQIGETPNAIYMQVVALADTVTTGVDEVWLEGEKLTLVPPSRPDSGGPAALQYRKSGNGFNDVDHLWFRFYDGTQTQADPWMVSAFQTAERSYGPDRIGRGISYAVVTAVRDDITREDPLFKGLPQCKFTLRGMPLYDVSRDSTAGGDGPQRWSDPSTWGGDGDDLPAVQIYNILRGITYHGEWLYGLQNASPAILPAANWIEAINKCRQTVEGPDGPEPQYRAGAQVNVDTPPADVIEALLKACQGRLAEVGGVYRLHVGVPDAPALAFSDGDVLSTEEQAFDPFHALADSINGVIAKYPEPREGWNVKTAPPLYNAAFEALDGNRRLMADVDLATVPYHGQVQRLIKSALEEARRERRHTLTLPPWAQCLEPGDNVAWTSARNGYVAKWFRVDGMAYKANLDVMVQLVEVDPADYDWNQATDYTPPTFSPMVLLRTPPQPMVDWSAEGQIVYDEHGLPRRPAILLAWDGAKQDVDGVEFEIRDGAAVLVHRGRTDNARAGSILVTQSLLPASEYQARGRYIPTSPRATAWSDWLRCDTPDVRLGLVDFEDSVRKQVTEILDQRIGGVLDRIAELATVTQQALARTALDKREVRTQLAARSDDALARIDEVRTVAVTAEAAVAQLEQTVGAEFGPLKATVEQNATAIATLDGYAAAQWSVAVDASGNAIGLVLFDDSDGVNGFGVTADNFFVSFPGQPGGTTRVPVFAISNVNGVAKVALRGDMLVDGSLMARMFAAGQIQGIHIGAQQIDTLRLAINSVDILHLIDGAATKEYFAPHGAVEGAYQQETVVASLVCEIKSGKASIDWNAGIDIRVASGAGYPPGFYAVAKVDGVEVQRWYWSTYDQGAAPSGNRWWEVREPFSVKAFAQGLPYGPRTFQITIPWQGTGAYFTGGFMRVQDLRK